VLACRFWDNNDKDDDNGRSLKASNHILTQKTFSRIPFHQTGEKQRKQVLCI
jgi:hypothetical protein